VGIYVRHFRLTCELANSYVVCDGASGDAWLVDVGEMSPRLVDWVEKTRLRLTAIFITHSHYDHNGAVDAYLARYPNVRVYGGSQACAGAMTTVVGDGAELTLGVTPARVISVPGHTPDHLALHFPSENILFSGDALFAGSIGGTSSDALKTQLVMNLKTKVLCLPADTIIYPGHGPPTTVRIEKLANPFLASAD
jgi:glyoxylase-like metal-dependent hydrolase (beta-lactamase superfamily II)